MKFITWIILALTKKFQTKITTSNTDKLFLFETTTSINDSPLVTATISVRFNDIRHHKAKVVFYNKSSKILLGDCETISSNCV